MNIIIRQRENGKWQAIISYKNKKGKWLQKSKGGFEKRKDANLWANEMSFELQKLEKSGILGNEYTLEEVFELYLARMSKSNNGNSKISKELYRNQISIFSDFMKREISSIKSIELFNFIEEKRQSTGYKYNVNISFLSTLFNFAIKRVKACEHNPCDLLYYDKSDNDSRIKFITEDLYQKILQGAEKDKLKLLIQLLYETGLRVSEALGLCTQSVFDSSVKIERQFLRDKRVLTDELKTKNSYRTVPISEDLYKKLKKATFDIQGRIFYDVSYNMIYYHLNRYGTSPHCFRHTRATILVSSGMDLTVVAYVIGDNINTIMRRYVEINKDNMENKFEFIRSII
ncbi:site-specific integrase [Peptoniphilus raoultii]|uniref:site-specific integrase n=1 Tax=Peptoniphilus raoultii TaxID=1776387 RepID=UPI0008D93FC0|nr:tyrosine-type recombinase/integrase [Peptoniphilus raoultii]